MKTKKGHYISGIIISIFIGIHLINHCFSLIGIEKHIEVMDRLRLIYRNIFVEAVLLIAIGFQIFSGVKLFFRKRKHAKKFFPKLQIYTGLYLAFFLLIHVSAVLGGRILLQLNTNFYFGAAGLNTFPFNLFFIPYYSLAITAFFGHIAAIHSYKMKKTLLGISPQQQAMSIFILGICLTVVILFGMTNGFSGILLPEEYHILIGK